jgi:transposase-like protein
MKKDKIGRNEPLYYPEEFKRKVIEEHLRTGIPKLQIQRKYGIHFKSGIITWMRSLGYLPAKEKGGKLVATNYIELAKRTRKQPPPDTAEAEIARLKRQLEDEQLRSQMYLRMIDIAEKEYHIPIRKKPDTK